MMDDKPLVSIVIPTYYRNKSLADVIESTNKLSYDNLECIVVDDSGDGHAKCVVSQYSNVNYVQLDQNRGANVARSEGIRVASGDYIQLLDDDDKLIDGKIEKQVDILQNKERVGVVYCGQVYASKKVVLPKENGKGNVLRLALADELKNCVTSTLLIDSDIAQKIIPLPDTPGSDDTYIKIELAKRTMFDFIKEPLIIRGDSENSRESGDNAIEGMKHLLEHYEELYEEHPDVIKKKLVANIYHREARHKLYEELYSFYSIQLFIQATISYPGINKKYVCRTTAAFFGRPGIEAIEWSYNLLQKYLIKNKFRE